MNCVNAWHKGSWMKNICKISPSITTVLCNTMLDLMLWYQCVKIHKIMWSNISQKYMHQIIMWSNMSQKYMHQINNCMLEALSSSEIFMWTVLHKQFKLRSCDWISAQHGNNMADYIHRDSSLDFYYNWSRGKDVTAWCKNHSKNFV